MNIFLIALAALNLTLAIRNFLVAREKDEVIENLRSFIYLHYPEDSDAQRAAIYALDREDEDNV